MSIFFAIFSFTLLGVSLRPVECLAVIKPDTDAGFVHIIKFFHRLDQSRLRSRGDKPDASFPVYLHINAIKIRKSDQEIMLRLAVIFSCRYLLYPFQQRLADNVPLFSADTFWYAFKLLFKFLSVRFFCLNGQYRLATPARLRVFMRADVVFLVDQIWRYQQREEFALFQCFSDVFVKFLARHQVFVIPYGNIPAQRVFMYEPHELVRKPPVLFPVTQKDVRVKRAADPLCRFIIHKYGMEEFLQFLLIRYSGRVHRHTVQILPFPEFVRTGINRV